MKIHLSLALLVLYLAYSHQFTLSSIFGGTEVDTAEGVEPESSAQESSQEEFEKIIKLHKPKPVLKPIVKPALKPIVKPIVKPVIHKKPIKAVKPVKSKLQKLKDLKKKKVSFFSHLALPFFSIHKIKGKLPLKNKLKLVPTKTEYVEVTKKITVHPVCYITLKKKKPCIKSTHHSEVDDDVYDGKNLEIEEDMGDVEQEEEDDSWPRSRQNRSYEEPIGEQTGEVIETSSGSISDVIYDNVQATDDDDTASITYTVDVQEELQEPEESEEPFRRGRYIDFIEPAEPTSEEYPLESSEEVEERFKKLSWETKTVLVTRIERYTDTKVTATVIAKNCAPVSPSVPKCTKKTHAVIRDRPDNAGPLVIESTPALLDIPPKITFHAKEIIDETAQESTVQEEVVKPEEPTIVEKA